MLKTALGPMLDRILQAKALGPVQYSILVKTALGPICHARYEKVKTEDCFAYVTL